jgi:hypothetical protein
MTLARRTFLAGAGANSTRGAADGLNTVIPYADPAYATLRGPLAIDAATATRLDGSFALHPALQQLGALYGSGEALFMHAVASAYRERSHFDGQNVLESGGTAAYQLKDGWLNLRRCPRPATTCCCACSSSTRPIRSCTHCGPRPWTRAAWPALLVKAAGRIPRHSGGWRRTSSPSRTVRASP